MISDIIRLTAKLARPIDFVTAKLVCSEKELYAAISKANKQGYAIRVSDGYVYSRPPLGEVTKEVTLGSAKPGLYKVAYITDIHAGSMHCLGDRMVDFLKFARKQGATAGVCTGDILDGNKPILFREQRRIGWDGQTEEFVSAMKAAPRFPAGWVSIDGNHDGYFTETSGMVSGMALAKELRAAGIVWQHSGQCLGQATVHGARVRLWHPFGGAATRNSVRRILNARAEYEAASGPRPDFLLMGHFHKFAHVPVFPERIHAVAGGTWQYKASEFANRGVNSWDVGGTIFSYRVEKDRSISSVSVDFYSYL